MSELKPPTFRSYAEEREARIAEILRRVQRQLHNADELSAEIDRQKTQQRPTPDQRS